VTRGGVTTPRPARTVCSGRGVPPATAARAVVPAPTRNPYGLILRETSERPATLANPTHAWALGAADRLTVAGMVTEDAAGRLSVTEARAGRGERLGGSSDGTLA
jgi:hypothetical protein